MHTLICGLYRASTKGDWRVWLLNFLMGKLKKKSNIAFIIYKEKITSFYRRNKPIL